MGYEESTTNNRMEMMAVLSALEHLEPVEDITVRVYTDSQLIVNTMTGKCNSSANGDLWKKLNYMNLLHSVDWVKVKGHSGILYNHESDVLATYCIENKIEHRKLGYRDARQLINLEDAA